jgi:hypothetical protein
MNLAKVVNGFILDHGVGTQDNVIYSDEAGMSVVPLPDWALELRLKNTQDKYTSRILKWDYQTRQFKILDLGSFVK